jgi:hypothetical protein
MRDGKWYEVGMPSIKWRDDYKCWVLERTARRNTRCAMMMNVGMEFYKSIADTNQADEQIEKIKKELTGAK